MRATCCVVALLVAARRMRMKLLLTGVAALLLAIGTAHANDLLPESVLGRWCHDGNISNESGRSLFSSSWVLL